MTPDQLIEKWSKVLRRYENRKGTLCQVLTRHLKDFVADLESIEHSRTPSEQEAHEWFQNKVSKMRNEK